MKTETRESLAAQAAERWRRQYENTGYWEGNVYDNQPRKEKHAQLVALGPNPAPEDVNRIIGNDSWTALTCDGCKRGVDKTVEVSAPDAEYTHELCEVCLWEAVRAFYGSVRAVAEHVTPGGLESVMKDPTGEEKP